MTAEQTHLDNMRDSSLYWIEYAARYKHSRLTHLQPVGVAMSHFVFFCGDVFAFGAIIIVYVIALVASGR
jgi:hypothetical protein